MPKVRAELLQTFSLLQAYLQRHHLKNHVELCRPYYNRQFLQRTARQSVRYSHNTLQGKRSVSITTHCKAVHVKFHINSYCWGRVWKTKGISAYHISRSVEIQHAATINRFSFFSMEQIRKRLSPLHKKP